jgi:hypothetical protein
MNLRQFARNKPCQVRIYGVCNYSPETTVLAHLRVGGVAGMGQKPPDIAGVFACSACHSVIDGRTPSDLNRLQLEAHMLHGLVRTLKVVSEEYELKKK